MARSNTVIAIALGQPCNNWLNGKAKDTLEKSFREGKKELGINEYQTRSEESYNKHIAMIMLGQLFLNEEKMYHYEHSTIWLTTQDVIHAIRAILHSVLRNIEVLLQHILAKQPPNKRFMKKLLYIRI